MPHRCTPVFPRSTKKKKKNEIYTFRLETKSNGQLGFSNVIKNYAPRDADVLSRLVVRIILRLSTPIARRGIIISARSRARETRRTARVDVSRRHSARVPSPRFTRVSAKTRSPPPLRLLRWQIALEPGYLSAVLLSQPCSNAAECLSSICPPRRFFVAILT